MLSDPQKRATYDQFGHAGMDSMGAGGFGGGFSGGGFDDLNDIFGSFFGGGFGGGGSRAGQRPAQGSGPLHADEDPALWTRSSARRRRSRLTWMSSVLNVWEPARIPRMTLPSVRRVTDPERLLRSSGRRSGIPVPECLPGLRRHG